MILSDLFLKGGILQLPAIVLLPLLTGCASSASSPRVTEGASAGGMFGGLGGANSTLPSSGGTGGGSPAGFGGSSAQGNSGGAAAGGSTVHAGGTGGTQSSGSGGAFSAAGGNVGSGGAGGSGSDFQPCPGGGAPCRILPLGDSITFGVGSTHEAGYRLSLFRAATQAGKLITFVGSADPNGPSMVDSVPFPRAHEGHSGFTIAQIRALTSATLQANTPHIVLLHIGTNDAEEQQTDRPSPSALGGLIDQIAAEAPNALIVVAQIIPLINPDVGLQAGLSAYNQAIPNLVSTRAASGMHIISVNMNAALAGSPSSETMADDYHPNDVGYDLMGAAWFASIAGTLR
ncbi:MAG: SGNH/GDSL hydrolase family protein [Polyangiaceae bacterium]|nr:SGNH/GDSL hydrolase family protein [Polyangiaceae bacterium]